MLAALVLAVSGADPFYVPPDPMPQTGEGTVLRSERFTGGPALSSAAENYRLLYETRAGNGTLVAVSGTLAIPGGTPPAAGWPLISWAHGTTGNAPQCAPSRETAPNVEQRMLDRFVKLGYAVAATDYEGIGTPGIHPYMVPLSEVRDVTDIARAAREIDPHVGRNWIVMGHSQGGAAALATAAAGQQLAPELKLVGAVSYAPFATPDGLLRDELNESRPNQGLVILGLMIEAFATVDSKVIPTEILEPAALQAMPELQQRCLLDLWQDSDWLHFVPRDIFAPKGESSTEALYRDLIAADPINFSITLPTLLVNGISDFMVPSESTLYLRDHMTRNGTPVTFKAYLGATHGSVLLASLNDVAAWVGRRFAKAENASAAGISSGWRSLPSAAVARSSFQRTPTTRASTLTGGASH
ncbi:MAG: alpha/beta fold hydrolase [Candidatus Eremiobacteraeota bacterium]|nr:alpha/beta fold hydrolase [Candidatus Eremiobacteraeota bacterium]